MYLWSLQVIQLICLKCVMMVQNDKKTGRPKVWIYRDKVTGMPKGEATITYDDDQAASSAIDWFNSKQNNCVFKTFSLYRAPVLTA